ncbi:hypothetical protein BDV33DRAFT_174847 [Aspergillus novoparasiticus]|uniref:Uncharacterized protein n=1 Tax=Aspergillus novoparasiticus TaxID=986946 RepID=A0A5N6ENN9_9EURO|nr:hypothetical protein BDV33DRAFT_174847 [Aspergillus novoparasiticus]
MFYIRSILSISRSRSSMRRLNPRSLYNGAPSCLNLPREGSPDCESREYPRWSDPICLVANGNSNYSTARETPHYPMESILDQFIYAWMLLSESTMSLQVFPSPLVRPTNLVHSSWLHQVDNRSFQRSVLVTFRRLQENLHCECVDQKAGNIALPRI